MSRRQPRLFFWRGRLRTSHLYKRVREIIPARPAVMVRAEVYEAVQRIARKRGVNVQTVMDEVLSGLPRIRVTQSGRRAS